MKTYVTRLDNATTDLWYPEIGVTINVPDDLDAASTFAWTTPNGTVSGTLDTVQDVANILSGVLPLRRTEIARVMTRNADISPTTIGTRAAPPVTRTRESHWRPRTYVRDKLLPTDPSLV